MNNGNRYFQPCFLAAINEANKSHVKYKHKPVNKAKNNGSYTNDKKAPHIIPVTNNRGTRWRKPIDSLST